jgi:anion-transporting  ArsA/GET3 family ATPase
LTVSLRPLLLSRRVIVCVGCGGVGKTTTAAALGLAGAMAGRRTLCLTIDPARRLAESLGLKGMGSEAQLVDPARFVKAGLRVPGSLTVMMLDPKRTFDDLVERYASTPLARDRILRNRLYQYVSTSLAGTQEYMAMEKLYALRADRTWDLIVLDTPPTTNALDFLDAPERMVDALDSAVLGWMLAAARSTGRFSLSLLARSAAAVLRGISRLTGYGFLEALAEFLVAFNELFGGFRRRATEVSAGLRGSDNAYVLVTSPDPMSIREIVFFAERLRELGMPRDVLVINRVHPYTRSDATQGVEEALRSHGVVLAEGGADRVRHAAEDEAREGALDRAHLDQIPPVLTDGGTLRIEIPAFGGDVRDLPSLARVAEMLAPPT